MHLQIFKSSPSFILILLFLVSIYIPTSQSSQHNHITFDCSSGTFLFNQSCYSSCPTGYIPSLSTATCNLCLPSCSNSTNSNCLSCSIGCSSCASLNSSVSCCTCEINFYLDINTKNCSSCPLSNQYADGLSCYNCSSGCAECSYLDSCTKCNPGYFLYQNSCLSTCPIGYVADDDSNTCLPCLPSCSIDNSTTCNNCSEGCGSCSSNTYCCDCELNYQVAGSSCTQCANYEYGDGKQCWKSPSTNCSNFDGIDNCTSCYTNFLYKGRCEEACPAGTVADRNIQECLPCLPACISPNDTNCFNCTEGCASCGSATSDCCECKKNYQQVYPSACIPCYDKSSYGDGHNCFLCDENCQTCEYLDHCTECYSSHYLFNGKCLEQCPENYITDVDSWTCIPCLPSCEFFPNGTNCTSSCPEGCTSCGTNGTNIFCCSCDIGFIYDNQSFTCSSCESYGYCNGVEELVCDNNCQTCEYLDFCTACYEGILLNGMCVSDCPSGFILEGSKCLECTLSCQYSNITGCIDCPDGCLSCGSSSSQCCSCDEEYANIQGNCTVCPDGFYNALDKCLECNKTCEDCDASGLCSLCNKGYLLYNEVCVDNCPQNFYPNSQAGTCETCFQSCSINQTALCQNCSEGCEYCLDPNTCCSCELNYQSINGSCQKCNTGSYGDGSHCYPCFENCAACNYPNNCTICNAGYYLYAGRCVNSCPSYYFQTSNECQTCLPSCENSTDINCNNCPEGCSSCTNDQKCCSCEGNFAYNQQNGSCYTCPEGQFGDGVNCNPCDSTCLTCEFGNNCTQCKSGYFSVENYCAPSCPDGTFSNTSALNCDHCYPACDEFNDKDCIHCPSGCTLCTNSSSCCSCDVNFQYNNISGQCLSCPAGTYGDGSSCLFCGSDCLTCVFPDVCDSCAADPTLYLYKQRCLYGCPNGTFTNQANLTCDECLPACQDNSTENCFPCDIGCGSCTEDLTCCSCAVNYTSAGSNCSLCPQGQFGNGNSCSNCDPACLTCSYPGICESCQSGYYLSDGKCAQSCPVGYLSNGSTSTCDLCLATCNGTNQEDCYECPTFCSSCTSNQACCGCMAGSFQAGMSCQLCPSNSILVNDTCLPCALNCVTCSSNANNSCLSCSQGWFLYQNTCLASCPIGYFANPFTQVCEECSYNCTNCGSKDVCLSCQTGFFLEGSICTPCNLSCNSCQSLYSCTVCAEGFYLFDLQCLAQCPSEYFGNSTLRECQGCSPFCANCSDSIGCSVCNPDYSLENGTCIKCPDHSNGNGTVCVACSDSCLNCTFPNICLECGSNYFLLNGTCYKDCPPGYYKNATTLECEPCNSGCLSCTNSTFCEDCEENLYLVNGVCSTCPNGYYGNGTDCLSCLLNCFTCDYPDICSQCLNGTYLLNNTCNSICPNGYYANNQTYTCNECPVNCTTCDESDCLNCNQGLYWNGTSCTVTVNNNISNMWVTVVVIGAGVAALIVIGILVFKYFKGKKKEGEGNASLLGSSIENQSESNTSSVISETKRLFTIEKQLFEDKSQIL